jgi:hypothetical protein
VASIILATPRPNGTVLSIATSLVRPARHLQAGIPSGRVETSCKGCHDTLIQRDEARGYVIGCDEAGRPLAPDRLWNRT